MSEYWNKQLEASKDTESKRVEIIELKCSRCVKQTWCMKSFPESCQAGDFVYDGKVETKSSHDLIISSGIDTLHMVYKLRSYKDSIDGHMPEDLKKYLLDARFLARIGKTKVVFCGEEFEIAKFGLAGVFERKPTVMKIFYIFSRSYYYQHSWNNQRRIISSSSATCCFPTN